MKVSPHPYVYQLTHRTTGHFYFGYRCKNKVPASQDLGVHYFTSGKTTKKNFSDYDHHVVAEFLDAEAAYDFEQGLIFEHRNDPLLLNKQYRLNGGKRWTCTAFSARSRKQMSKSAKKHRATLTDDRKEQIYSKVSAAITGTENPRALDWRVEFEDGRPPVVVRSLATWCEENHVEYLPLYHRTKTASFWRGIRAQVVSDAS